MVEHARARGQPGRVIGFAAGPWLASSARLVGSRFVGSWLVRRGADTRERVAMEHFGIEFAVEPVVLWQWFFWQWFFWRRLAR